MQIIKVIEEALEEYEKAQKRRIDELQYRIDFLEKERAAVIKRLKDNNINLLKEYFGINE